MTKINENSTVTVNYTGRFEDGTVFDSSMVEGREPLVATLGQGQLIRGFEQGLLEMEVGQKKTVEINPENAYGEINESMIQEVPKDRVPQEVEVGQMLQANTPMGLVNFNVLEVREETVLLDANHPLAGKKLIFDLEVVGIN
jgi:FKBP-type peptidyl-prolyl cis-trans isomerase 2